MKKIKPTVVSKAKFEEQTVCVFLPTVFSARRVLGKKTIRLTNLKKWIREKLKGKTFHFSSEVPHPYPTFDFCVWIEDDEERKLFRAMVGPLAYTPGPEADEIIAKWKKRWAANMIQNRKIENDLFEKRQAKRRPHSRKSLTQDVQTDSKFHDKGLS